jgi:hypothetical protein
MRKQRGDLFAVLLELAERINAEPIRERLIRRWKAAREARKERIEFETHKIEWLPLMRRIYHRDSLEDRERETTSAAETLLRLEGWQSAYTFALEIAPFLPETIEVPDAQAFLAELIEQYDAAKAAHVNASLILRQHSLGVHAF